MTEHEKYQEHIRHTHNAFCMVVIRHAAISDILREIVAEGAVPEEVDRAKELLEKTVGI